MQRIHREGPSRAVALFPPSRSRCDRECVPSVEDQITPIRIRTLVVVDCLQSSEGVGLALAMHELVVFFRLWTPLGSVQHAQTCLREKQTKVQAINGVQKDCH